MRLFTLTNAAGMEVRATTYGVILVSIRVPDRQGRFDDVVIGHENLEGYLTKSRYFGAVVGRYGNRIAGGKVTIDGHDVSADAQQRPQSPARRHQGLRQGRVGREMSSTIARGPSVVFTHTSPDGHEGYPGTLAARVAYTLTDDNELIVEYSATTDKPTIVNMTQHSYFNLAGDGSGDITRSQHDAACGPLYAGRRRTRFRQASWRPSTGTPFDFRSRDRASASASMPTIAQLKGSSGYDHNFVLSRKGSGLEPAARVVDPGTGRTMEVSTTEPGMQFYYGQQARWLDGRGRAATSTRRATGLCLETQHFPDSPNKPSFPSTVLRPGEQYQSTTVFKFGVFVASPLKPNRRSRDQEVKRLRTLEISPNLLIF